MPGTNLLFPRIRLDVSSLSLDYDGAVMAKGVELAHQAGIPTISYDRLITGTDKLDLYVTFDNVKVGILQAEYIINALSAIEKPRIIRLLGSKTDNNAFLFKPPSMRVEFMPVISEFSGHADAVFAELKASLRVEDVSAYSQA